MFLPVRWRARTLAGSVGVTAASAPASSGSDPGPVREAFLDWYAARPRMSRRTGPTDRDRVTVYEPEDCDELIRQYLEQPPGPTLIPIQV